MEITMKRGFVVFLISCSCIYLNAQQPEGDLIMGKSRDMTLMGSMSATINLTITEKGGSSRKRAISMTTKSYPDGIEKRLIRFIEPADVRGTAMLIVDNKVAQDEMWIYLPALKKTRRIVSSEKGKSFMSSEFSNADMSSPTISDFVHKHIAGSGSNNQWIIESTPVSEGKADEYGYSKKISYINSENYQVEKMELYNFDNELFKVVEINDVLPLSGGKFIVTNMTANNLITSRKSEIIMTDIKENLIVDDAYFSLQNLEK
jgi:hypothetical protein